MPRSWNALGTSALAISLAVAVAPPGSATPGGPAMPEPVPAASTAGHGAVRAVDRYRLATGDTVRVLTMADGTRVPRVSAGRPFLWSGGPDSLYVVPRTAPARLRTLDLSLFDTTALARATRHGRTPVVVRYRRWARPAALAGLRPTSDAHRTGRSTVVHATLGRRFAGFDASDLRSISSIRLDAPHPDITARATPAPTHTVRVHVTDGDGSPADYAMVTLQDTVDGDAYLEQADVGRAGVATFKDVPEGEYSTVVQTFEAVLVDRELSVTADSTIEMNLADATVRPHVSLEGHHVRWTSLTVQRDPEQGFAIPFGYAGPHFDMRVQPTPGTVRHGALHTGVTAVLVSGRAADGYDDVALTGDVAEGVPGNLTFVHRRRDFARVTDRFYGNGTAAPRTLTVIPGSTRADISMGGTDLRVPVPGTLRVWMQAGPDSYAQQTVFPLARPGTLEDINQVGDLRRYPVAGNRAPLDLLHGPVGPGLELGPHARTGAGAERLGDHLHLFVPLLAGAGAPSFAFADRRDADWALHRGRRTLARGHQVIAGDIAVPHGPRTYRLSATTHPGPAWDLSTRVSARWVFHSRAGQGAVPLLTPRYTPPTNLAGSMGPGATGFALTFHSTPHSARVTRATVELSDDDGRSWRRVRVTRTSALTFHVGYRNPSAHGDVRYVSLRLTARDAKHSSVQETAIHAYRLR